MEKIGIRHMAGADLIFLFFLWRLPHNANYVVNESKKNNAPNYSQPMPLYNIHSNINLQNTTIDSFATVN